MNLPWRHCEVVVPLSFASVSKFPCYSHFILSVFFLISSLVNGQAYDFRSSNKAAPMKLGWINIDQISQDRRRWTNSMSLTWVENNQCIVWLEILEKPIWDWMNKHAVLNLTPPQMYLREREKKHLYLNSKFLSISLVCVWGWGAIGKSSMMVSQQRRMNISMYNGSRDDRLIYRLGTLFQKIEGICCCVVYFFK